LWVGFSHGLELQQDDGFDDRVRAKEADLFAAKMDRNRNFALDPKPQVGQDALHGRTVDRFGKSRPELAIDLIESAQDTIGELFMEQCRPVLSFFRRHSALSANSAAT
jgi:hypothetical protein